MNYKSLPQIESQSFPHEKIRKQMLEELDKKIIVLDDDPTGVQCIHDLYVYTNYDKEAIRDIFHDKKKMAFILTNSRSLSEKETIALHTKIAENLSFIAKECNQDFILISRGDSTLRGHYPLETNVLVDVLEKNQKVVFNGEILIPYFKEGGRFTFGDTHYVQDGATLVPAGETEFAKDKTFGFKHSNLIDYMKEKHKDFSISCTSISLEMLRNHDYEAIIHILENEEKIIVNAIDDYDLQVFTYCLLKVIDKGKRFIYRTAASFTKLMSVYDEIPLLKYADMVDQDSKHGGLIVVGSHVKKTTQQVEQLKNRNDVAYLEFNQHLVLDQSAFKEEISRVVFECEHYIQKGKNVVVSTRRERFDLPNGSGQQQLELAVLISNALVKIVESQSVRPSFLIAKGGITSSDIGTKALHVKKALVLGQIQPGVPVWKCKEESKFPNLSYIIFPGNVGDENTLANIVFELTKEDI